jgi:hypothetical protein
MVASMKTAIFLDDALCSLEGLPDVSEELTAPIISTSETSVKFHQTTWRNIPEDSHLQLKASLYQCLLTQKMSFVLKFVTYLEEAVLLTVSILRAKLMTDIEGYHTLK